MTRIRIGTRGSKLALLQASLVKERIEALDAQVRCEVVVIKTTGDRLKGGALNKKAGKGFFTKEIEEALLEDRVDIAVHSAKDLPTELPQGLLIGGIPERELSNDVLISEGGKSLGSLPPGARIGTSSLRRRAQLLHNMRELNIVELRGNLDTRMRKLKSDNLDGIVVAFAGVRRLGLAHVISEVIPHNIILPAAGQGALAVELRGGDTELYTLVDKLNHRESWLAVTSERSFIKGLRGGCHVPAGAYGYVDDGDTLVLEGIVSNIDGTKVIRRKMEGKSEDAEEVGRRLAEEVLRLGGDEILAELREWEEQSLG